jgi:hypothetical protein
VRITQQRVLIILLSLILAFTALPPVPSAEAADQPSAAVSEAIRHGFVPATLQGRYRQAITREEFSKLLAATIAKAAGKTYEELAAEGNLAALDVAAGRTGLPGKPGKYLQRKESAALLTRSADALGRYTYNLPVRFQDGKAIDAWTLNAANYAVHRGLMTAASDKFDPNGTVTIEQAIVLALRLYKDDGVLRLSDAERKRIAAEGQSKRANTRSGETRYPISVLTSGGQLIEINLGDPIGYALETDTTVYIDGRYVKSYAVGDKTVIDAADLAQFGYKLNRDNAKMRIYLDRVPSAKRVVYKDKVDKSKAPVGSTAFSLVASSWRVEPRDERDHWLSLAPSLPTYYTTTGKALIPVEFLDLNSNHYQLSGNVAYVTRPAGKKEFRLHTLDNANLPFATGYSRYYWAANQYPEYRAKLNKEQLQTLDKATSILQQVLKPGMTEFEKEKAIYDYMVTYGTYDYNTLWVNHYGREPNPDLPPSNDDAYNSYGALIEGLAVCSGWADAYHLLFTLAGLESKVQIGTLYGEAHAWVSVQVDGEWYQVESTAKSDVPEYRQSFNFTYADGGQFLGYGGGDRRAVSRKYDDMNEMEFTRDPDAAMRKQMEEE